jgi:putative exporter of polyketide antibiotics
MKSKYLLQPSRSDRGWFVNPYSDHNPWWIMILTALPALVAVILTVNNEQSRETGNIGYTRRRKTKTQQNRCWTPLCANKHN